MSQHPSPVVRRAQSIAARAAGIDASEPRRARLLAASARKVALDLSVTAHAPMGLAKALQRAAEHADAMARR